MTYTSETEAMYNPQMSLLHNIYLLKFHSLFDKVLVKYLKKV